MGPVNLVQAASYVRGRELAIGDESAKTEWQQRLRVTDV